MTELQMVCCWCVECLVATFVDISWVGRRVASVMEDVAQRFDVGVASTLQRVCNKGAVDMDLAMISVVRACDVVVASAGVSVKIEVQKIFVLE